MAEKGTTAWLRSIGLLIFHSINVFAAVFLAMKISSVPADFRASVMNMAFLLLGISGGTTSLDGLRARLRAGDFSGAESQPPTTRVRMREPTRRVITETDKGKPL